jgi:hypothetical protein
MKTIIIAIIMSLVFVGSVLADEAVFVTGKKLLENCQSYVTTGERIKNGYTPSPVEILLYGRCQGYLSGMSEGQLYGAFFESYLRGYKDEDKTALSNATTCRDKTPYSELYPMFIDYLKIHTELADKPVQVLFLKFMMCQEIKL